MEIIEQRSAEAARLERLRAERGAALLDGRTPDNAAIAEAEAALEALDDAEAEATRRAREAAAMAHGERAKVLRAELQDLEAARLKATEQAETHARQMADALRLCLSSADRSRKIMAELGGIRPTFDMTAHGVTERLSRSLASQIRSVEGHPTRFGVISFGTSALPDPKRSWTD